MHLPRYLRPRPQDIAIAALFALPWSALLTADSIVNRTPRPQPIRVILGTGDALVVDVARTSEERRQGLADRATLPTGRGMLFVLPRPDRPKLWMRGVSFPLDIVFVRDGRVIEVLHGVPPCGRDFFCPTYSPSETVDTVLELNKGEAQQHGILPGKRLITPPSIPNALSRAGRARGVALSLSVGE